MSFNYTLNINQKSKSTDTSVKNFDNWPKYFNITFLIPKTIILNLY